MGAWSDLFTPNADDSSASNFSNTGDADRDAVSNRDGGKYDEKDAARETGVSNTEAHRAHHQARDDNDAGMGTDRHEDNAGWSKR